MDKMIVAALPELLDGLVLSPGEFEGLQFTMTDSVSLLVKIEQLPSQLSALPSCSVHHLSLYSVAVVVPRAVLGLVETQERRSTTGVQKARRKRIKPYSHMKRQCIDHCTSHTF
jgi:hypothetical protein